MKVLHAAETIQGGVATVLKQLAIWQSESPDYKSVKCLIPENQSSQLDPLNEELKIGYKRSGRNVLSLLNFSITLIKAIYKERPNIVHFHSTFAGILGRVIVLMLYPICRPKVVYCPHAFAFLMSNKGKVYRSFYTVIEKLFLTLTDKVICVSDYERNEAINSGLSARKLVTIHNGVPVKNIDNSGKENPLPKDKINIVFIGRFDYQKGYDILLDSMKKINDGSFHLTAIGSGVLGDFHYENENNITYTGWLPSESTELYLSFSDILVIPSRWEGFAMVPLEAMSFGIPIIASNTTSFPEVIINNKTGLLFDINDPDSLVNMIKSYEKNEFSLMGAAGRERFLQNFTSDKMIDNTDALYKKLI